MQAAEQEEYRRYGIRPNGKTVSGPSRKRLHHQDFVLVVKDLNFAPEM
jgi:hypothetical protein